MDETSFFYRREPRGTLTTDKKEKGKKQTKVRVTVCVGTNADGSEKLPLHFVGKAKEPRPFKNHDVNKEMGATYTNTPKAWMNTVRFCVQLSNIRAEKLSPKTTAALQPMDQGIIKNLKGHYQNTKTAANLKDYRADKKYVGVGC
ncbi:putative Tigger transposable elementderived protein 6 [Phytophthora cinnamomi]|uniref:putative Tigger transposable elementderived protein 6 n=1 Tax=Phytophthora cinnamomi TaxID=4785 RepID=UPI002A267105|nr:putative Tigger transposable elementderived protein 6 [Phytophthora cinnamomi]KAJ8525798.1 hypothetical protein ON010_g15316 [Phytophthora cinnamomi]